MAFVCVCVGTENNNTGGITYIPFFLHIILSLLRLFLRLYLQMNMNDANGRKNEAEAYIKACMKHYPSNGGENGMHTSE